MSGLDQSLDQIMKDAKPTRARRGRRAPGATTKAVVPPVGGIGKKTRAPRPAKNNNNNNKAAVPAPAVVRPTGESKILVSGLPDDVSEQQLKEYFAKVVGAVKRVLLTYGPNGKSRGIATVIFAHGDSAAKAMEHNGTKVDGRPMRVEVIVGAKDVAAAAAPRKNLSDRITQPKNAAKAKPVASGPKPATNGAKKEAAPKAKKARGGKANRPKPKTADELDAEMKDYFGGGENGSAAAPTNGAAVNGAAPATTNGGGDVGMDDEIL